MKKTFMTYSFGCRVNEAEKVSLDKHLLERGFQWSDKNPDFYIINSCAVTGKAEREVRQHIYQIRKKFPKTKIIVTGCAATNWKQHALSVAGVDQYIENSKKNTIPDTLLQSVSRRAPLQRVNMVKRYHDKFLASGKLMVKIQDGCDRFCSYCIVPYLRGRPRSRLARDIVKEIKEHDEHLPYRPASPNRGEQAGVKEVILTAINTECFGKDTGETLIQLIDTILAQTTVPKISCGSIHPWSLTNEFLRYYSSIIPTHRFIPFFHVPIQSGSDKILKLMNRGYTSQDILGKLKKLKSINPDAFIGTDIIVGFPGEGEKEFRETYDLLKNAPIDKIHVFRFSLRPGTTAEKLVKVYGEPTPREKRERAKLLLQLNIEKSKKT